MFSKEKARQRRHGRDRQEYQRQHRAEVEHRPEGERQRQNVAGYGHDPGREELVQHVHVGGDPGDDAADRLAVEIRNAEALQLGEDFAPQVAHRPLAGQVHDMDMEIARRESGKQDGQV